MATTPRYLLLKDKSEEDVQRSGRLSFMKRSLDRGDILKCSPGSEQPEDRKKIALRAISTWGDIKLVCSMLDVTQLTDNDADLLIAVWPPKERLLIYLDKNHLTEAKTLNVDSKVFVNIRKQNNDLELRGAIRYKGSLHGLEGTRFGVELLDKESVAGCYTYVSDGTYEGKRYFTCPAGRGVFVPVNELRPRQDQDQEEYIGQKSDGRLAELATSLAEERKIREEAERRLHSSEQRSHKLELSFAAERQAHQETGRRLQSSEERLHVLETTLTTVRQAYEDYQRFIETTRDWVVSRDDITLSDKVIGVGAWGEVKEGIFWGCKVAVKKILQLILSDHNRRLFEQEMNMASRCRHPSLLQFIGATNDNQSPLFVTELLDTSLRAVLHERPLEPPEITTIALDVGKALNYLHLSHPAPIIHRDISSAKVLLWKHVTIWRAKVSDYGTANFLQQSMTTCPGAVIYSAPEAQTSRQSPKLDVYSFGVLLCEMNVREMPDVERRNVQVAMVTNSLFRNLIRRCLQQNPEERPSMAEIIETLENSQQ